MNTKTKMVLAVAAVLNQQRKCILKKQRRLGAAFTTDTKYKMYSSSLK
jgi:hypothetical protein